MPQELPKAINRQIPQITVSKNNLHQGMSLTHVMWNTDMISYPGVNGYMTSFFYSVILFTNKDT